MNQQAGKRLSRGFLITLAGIAVFLLLFGVLVMRVRGEANERWAAAVKAIEEAEIGGWGAIRTIDRGAPLPVSDFSTYQHRFRNWQVGVFQIGGPLHAGSSGATRVNGVELEIDGEPAGFDQTAAVRMKLGQRRTWLFAETWGEIGVRAGELDGRLVQEARLVFDQLGLEAKMVDERSE